MNKPAQYKCFDPRDARQSADVPATWTMTGNTVLILAMLQFERSEASCAMDWDKVAALASACDDTAAPRAGANVQRPKAAPQKLSPAPAGI